MSDFNKDSCTNNLLLAHKSESYDSGYFDVGIKFYEKDGSFGYYIPDHIDTTPHQTIEHGKLHSDRGIEDMQIVHFYE